jgi:serine/threonine protein kinase
MSNIIANKYQIISIISNGSYGIVYKGFHIKNENEKVAIKMEMNTKSLKNEVKIMNYLYSNKIRKIPAIYWYGSYNEYPCLIMSYYEISLSQYIGKKTWDLSKINLIMYKMLHIIFQIHNQFILHRDLKPDNFMIKNGELYLIDFGLATFYISDGGNHLPNEFSNTLIGSPNFISINIFLGNKYSRRDDLISLAYIYIRIILNDTPWNNTENDLNETIYSEIEIHHPINKIRCEKRGLNMILDNYCLGMTEKFIEYLKYVYGLEYDETPKYNYILELFS